MDELVEFSGETNKNIPACRFIENVGEFVGDRDPFAIAERARELLTKYNFVKRSLQAQVTSPKNKIPDIKDALQVVALLKKRRGQEFEAQFNLADILYATAKVPPTDVVYLWLGADTMVEYGLDEAQQILEKNLKVAEETIENNAKDLEWLQEQITKAEVNFARVHNFAICRMKERRPKEEEMQSTA